MCILNSHSACQHLSMQINNECKYASTVANNSILYEYKHVICQPEFKNLHLLSKETANVNLLSLWTTNVLSLGIMAEQLRVPLKLANTIVL